MDLRLTQLILDTFINIKNAQQVLNTPDDKGALLYLPKVSTHCFEPHCENKLWLEISKLKNQILKNKGNYLSVFFVKTECTVNIDSPINDLQELIIEKLLNRTINVHNEPKTVLKCEFLLSTTTITFVKMLITPTNPISNLTQSHYQDFFIELITLPENQPLMEIKNKNLRANGNYPNSYQKLVNNLGKKIITHYRFLKISSLKSATTLFILRN
jgi:hypothetical protein